MIIALPGALIIIAILIGFIGLLGILTICIQSES